MLVPKPMRNVTLSALVMFELGFQGRSDVVDIVSQDEVAIKSQGRNVWKLLK